MSGWETYPVPVRREIYAQAYEEVEITDEMARHYGLSGGRRLTAYSASYPWTTLCEIVRGATSPRD